MRWLARRIRLTVPHFVALGQVLASTDLIATVPERFAERVASPFDLVIKPLPVSLPDTAIHQFWHARLHRDPGCQWLRATIASTFGAESSPAEPSVVA